MFSWCIISFGALSYAYWTVIGPTGVLPWKSSWADIFPIQLTLVISTSLISNNGNRKDISKWYRLVCLGCTIHMNFQGLFSKIFVWMSSATNFAWRLKDSCSLHYCAKTCTWLSTVSDPGAFVPFINLKSPITSAADDNFYVSDEKQVLIFLVNRLLGRRFMCNVKTCFLWKMQIINNNFRMSSATNFTWRFKG